MVKMHTFMIDCPPHVEHSAMAPMDIRSKAHLFSPPSLTILPQERIDAAQAKAAANGVQIPHSGRPALPNESAQAPDPDVLTQPISSTYLQSNDNNRQDNQRPNNHLPPSRRPWQRSNNQWVAPKIYPQEEHTRLVKVAVEEAVEKVTTEARETVGKIKKEGQGLAESIKKEAEEALEKAVKKEKQAVTNAKKESYKSGYQHGRADTLEK